MKPIKFLSYDEIACWVEAQATEIMATDPVGLVAILRGGAFIANCLSFKTGLPVFFIKYDRQKQQASWVGEKPKEGLVIVCEDFAGSGSTLINSLAFIEKTNTTKTITLVHDELSKIKPKWSRNYAGYQVVLPWERHKVNQDHEKDWMSGGAMGDKKMKHDHEYKKVGVDLDGVLCKDLAEEKYEVNLEECLNERDELKKEDHAPALNKEVHVIITARPLEDEERTRKWLNRVGYHDIEMYLRKTNHKSWKDSAHHKEVNIAYRLT